MNDHTLSSRHVLSLLLAVVSLTLWGGCASAPRWPLLAKPCVLDPNITQGQLVEYLNQNVIGSDTQSGLVSWRTGNAKLRVSGIPVALPTMIAVEAPRNLRIVVSNPIGGQEVDIGSNDERFWVWHKEAPQIMTVRHEDVPATLQQIRMPIDIQPDWLMDVFGVIPIDGSEFQMVRLEAPLVELVAHRKAPSGQAVERVIRVNTCRGVITEHLLRDPGGQLIARASLHDHRTDANGTTLPKSVRLQWPSEGVELAIHLGDPEVNPASLAHNTGLWKLPTIPGRQVVDVGEMARQAMGPAVIAPAGHQAAPFSRSLPRPSPLSGGEASGTVNISSGPDLDAPHPFLLPERPEQNGPPEWVQQTTRRVSTHPLEDPPSSEFVLPSKYSAEASRSSSDQLPSAQE